MALKDLPRYALFLAAVAVSLFSILVVFIICHLCRMKCTTQGGDATEPAAVPSPSSPAYVEPVLPSPVGPPPWAVSRHFDQASSVPQGLLAAQLPPSYDECTGYNR